MYEVFMKIAVIDDHTKIHDQFMRSLFDEEVHCFADENQFIRTMESTVYDVIFLDICLNDTIGYAVGEAVRGSERNHRSVIVYISHTTEYVLRLFKTQPYDFLIKPLEDEAIRGVVERIRTEKLQHFTIQTRKCKIHVPWSNICSLQSELHRISIKTDRECHTMYGKLKDLQLPSPPFLRIHQSVFVNARRIKRYSRSDIELDNGECFSVSRRYREQVMKFMMEACLD